MNKRSLSESYYNSGEGKDGVEWSFGSVSDGGNTGSSDAEPELNEADLSSNDARELAEGKKAGLTSVEPHLIGVDGDWESDSEDGGSNLTSDGESDVSEQLTDEGGDNMLEAADTDTSDEEEVRNTIGNIPLEWYDDLAHHGYDIQGEKIAKSSLAKGDVLDEFLAKMDDVDYWRTIRDKVTGQEVVLTDEQIDMIHRLQKSSYPEQSIDPYEDYTDHFTHEKQVLPLSLAPKPKSSFIPSKWEQKKIAKLVHAIRMGWIKPHTPTRPKPVFYQLWGDGGEDGKMKHRVHIPAPRMQLPGHAESYNPPPEYLPSQQEKEEWLAQDEEDRDTNFIPKRYGALREVPCYPAFIKERFERCLDLYLCPRQRKMRVQVNPDDLIPELPRLSDLQPFPNTEALVYEGHTGLVQCVCVEPQGQWLASADSNGNVKIWEVSTTRCLHTLTYSSQIVALSFSPNTKYSLLAIATAEYVFFVNSQMGDHLVVKHTSALLSDLPLSANVEDASTSGLVTGVQWGREGDRVYVKHSKPVKQVCWHARGDYVATLTADDSGCGVYIHQLSKARSQEPFKKLKGRVQRVIFHPLKPLFFLATQTCVRVYDLVRQQLVKRLLSGVKWISCLAVHPSGDHLLIGSYDRKLCWFDLDLSSKPYKILRQHKQALRAVCFHSLYPLFASCSDDGSVIVCHGKIFNDLLQNPQIVPVKVLRGSSQVHGLGTLDVVFHPSQPWLFTAGADSIVRLYCN